MTSDKTHFINGHWIPGSGSKFSSRDPVTGETLWQGAEASLSETDHAVYAARNALEGWSALPVEERVAHLKNFQKNVEAAKADLAETVSRETGKPFWESLTELGAMTAKIDISVAAFRERTGPREKKNGAETSATRYKPHGVAAVFGPYNFPAHLANGHIVPALVAGNTVVFKPSELAPLVAQKTVELWQAAGLPAGVINLVQGGKNAGVALVSHPGLDGIFFTGSSQTGLALNKKFAEQPDKILALEMGGNNPLVVNDPADLGAAAVLTVLSAYITAGQRCTCARRLILVDSPRADDFLKELLRRIAAIRVGHHAERPEPFMGSLVTPKAAEDVLAEQARLVAGGAKILSECKSVKSGTGLLTPGLLDVTAAKNREDKEIFGPLLQLVRVADMDAALAEANNTRYGLSAGLLGGDRAVYEKFFGKIRAGIVNWNRQLTGASSAAPFGGIGLSGNHRPSAYFAADYCSYPVASMESELLELPQALPPGL